MLETFHVNFLDEEWMELMEQAKQIGLTVEEVQLFLLQSTPMENK